MFVFFVGFFPSVLSNDSFKQLGLERVVSESWVYPLTESHFWNSILTLSSSDPRNPDGSQPFPTPAAADRLSEPASEQRPQLSSKHLWSRGRRAPGNSATGLTPGPYSAGPLVQPRSPMLVSLETSGFRKCSRIYLDGLVWFGLTDQYVLETIIASHNQKISPQWTLKFFKLNFSMINTQKFSIL